MIISSSKDPPKSDVPGPSTVPPGGETPSQISKEHPKQGNPDVVATTPNDGFYVVSLQMSGSDFEAQVHLEMKSPLGYLSAVDWPLLPFYAVMCSIYVVLGVFWLVVLFWQWRDLLRIQFWIGGVILLGMLEKAMFYAEFYSINSTGVASTAAVLAAEWVSCGKRTLARMLVVIVSLGFGIVRPRLGSALHRVVAVGGCYLFLACVESYIRVVQPSADNSRNLLVASIPLAALDSIICWWIFNSLVQTTRQLRVRRFFVKLALYRHFTNTLIFAVLTSVVFMAYSIKYHRLVRCLKDWKALWVDDAFWHVLFSLILVVIMVLWRPTNNNQRYAFTPLLDNPDDDDDEEDQFVNDAFGVKLRSQSRAGSPKPKAKPEEENILEWVEDNIPSAGIETALPILDSDEEILTTQFHLSKMN